MTDLPEFRDRTIRQPGHFWADNEVYDVFGAKLGPHAFAVYMALCRIAWNETGECRISTRKIARQLGMSTGGVFNALGRIQELQLARKSQPGDSRNPAVYVLADVKSLVNPRNSVHRMNARAHPANAAFTERTRNKESKRLPSRLKTLGGETNNVFPSQLSQADFDERDLRKMAEAYREAEKRPSSVGNLDERNVFQWVCSRVGITIERGLRLEELQRTWPTKTSSPLERTQ